MWALSHEIYAQCDKQEINKKALSFYEKGINKKKYKKQERVKYLKLAIEAQEDYTDALFEYCNNLSSKYIYTKKPFGSLVEKLHKIEQLCPDYHSNVYFFLGEHYLNNKEYKKAIEYLQKFLDFKSEDDSKFARTYEKYKSQAKDDLDYASFYGDTYLNPVPFDPVLVEAVSTKADEYLPTITADNQNLYFTRKKEEVFNSKNGVVVKDQVFSSAAPKQIEQYVKSSLSNNAFNYGDNLPSPFNTTDNYNYGGASLTIDNKTMFVTICKPTKVGQREYQNCDIYASALEQHTDANGNTSWVWGPLTNLGPNINGKDTWEAQPSISSDGQTLFFATARKDTRGIDIFVSQKDEHGKWRPAISIGEPINTELNDKSPFMHNDNKTLYYASQGNLGFGGYDVFYTRFKEGTWSKPKNIGFPINSKRDEHGFVINLDGDQVYYSSDINKDKDKGLDIFTFELYEEARPEKVMLVKGTISDEDGRVPDDATVELKNSSTGEVSKVNVDKRDGAYTAVVSAKNDAPIIVNVKSKGKVFSSKLVPSKNKSSVQTVSSNLEQVQIGKPFEIHDIFYATNSSEIDAKSTLILNEFADYLKFNATMHISIQGHTDNVGSNQDNLVLSTDRAYNVKAYLESKGIHGSRIQFKGFGEAKPIASNETAQGRAENRRTEFVILKQ